MGILHESFKKYHDALVPKLGAMFAAKDHSHAAATTTEAGFMSASDKSKLDDLAAWRDGIVNADEVSY